MKIIMCEMKNTLAGISSCLNTAGKKIREFKDIAIETEKRESKN